MRIFASLSLTATLLFSSAVVNAQAAGIPDSQLHLSLSGLVLNRSTNTFDNTATITNQTAQSFSPVLSLEIPVSPTGAALANPTCKLPDGTPVVVIALPGGQLAPGVQVSGVVLKFNNPARVAFTISHTLEVGDVCANDVHLTAFSDSHPLPQPADVQSQLQALSAFYCLAVPSNPMTVAQALSSMTRQLDQVVGAGAIEGMMAADAQVSPQRLEATASAALLSKNGAGALAVLLVANHNEPTNPAHLVNAAGAAALISMPNEALALLDAADAIGGDFGTPMGINGHAIALNNRGFALLQVGNWAAAQSALSAANALEPFLSEARLNLAIAQLCGGAQDPVSTFISSVHRTPGHLTLDRAFDLSRGVAPNMPALPYPGSPDVLNAYATTWRQILIGLRQKTTAFSDQYNQVFSQYVHQEQANPPTVLTNLRFGEISGYQDILGTPAFDDQSPPGLEALYATVTTNAAAVLAESDAIFAANQAWFLRYDDALLHCSDAQPYCSAAFQQVLLDGRNQIRVFLGQFLTLEGRLEQSNRTFADPWYHAVTGLAANVSDPLRHRLRTLRSQIDHNGDYDNVIQSGLLVMAPLAQWWTDAQASDLPAAPTSQVPDAMGSLACPPQLKAASIGVDLEVFAITINCEKVEATIAAPLLGPFVQLSVPFKGDWTAFVGAQAKVPGTSLQAQVGVYVKGNDSSFTDAGIKTAQSIGAGPISFDSPTGIEFGVVDASKCFFGGCE